jgi:alpha-galactosidase
MKIVLIGAGSSVFTQGLIADFIQLKEEFEPLEIALVDIDQKALDSITNLSKKMINSKGANIKITSYLNRRKALPEADVVVTTVAVGGRRAWENDVLIPRKYGIFQPVGDTTMPGGISRAQRMIPVMLEIARDVKEICPQAYFFNYSNPMTAICQAIKKALDINVIGLCHGFIHVEHYLAKFLEVPKSQLSALGVGINHLTYMYDIRVNGVDAKEMLNDKLQKQKYNSDNLQKDDGVLDYRDNPFSWSIYEKFGVFPAVLDRHVVEFFPERFATGDYHGKKLGINAFSFEAVISDGDRTYEEMHEIANGTRELNYDLFNRTEGEHEQLVDILRSLYRNDRNIFSINMKNNGAVSNLPNHAVLELPAVASGRGFIPLHITDFPDMIASIIRKKLTVIDLTVEAALTGNFSLFVEALLADGSIRTEEKAINLANDLLQSHRKYLPQYFK